jgi:hypothetical protein
MSDTPLVLRLPYPQLRFQRTVLEPLSWPPPAPWVRDHTHMVRVVQRYDHHRWGVREISMDGGRGLGWLGLLGSQLDGDPATAVVTNHRIFVGPDVHERAQVDLHFGAPRSLRAALLRPTPQPPVPVPTRKLLQWSGTGHSIEMVVGERNDPLAVFSDSPDLWQRYDWVIADDHHALWPVFELRSDGTGDVTLVPYHSFDPKLGGPR